jgi:D-lactate dehydrogenase
MKAFVFSAHAYELPFLKRAAGEKHELIFTHHKLSLETAGMASGCNAIALFTADDASAPVLQKLKLHGIKSIALRSAGYDHVDLVEASRFGIKVANVPAYSPYAIAEHAAALLLAFNRKITEGQRLIQTSDFRLDTLVGFDIYGKQVGIIGTGTIGTVFAKIMNGFGAKLVGYDPVQNKEALSLGLKYTSLDELYKTSDVISIHCPLNEKTRHLISKGQISIMKKGCMIINTARGGIINTEDLLEALENGHLGGACLDVYEHEKKLFFEDHRSQHPQDPLFERLVSHKNVLITGHQAFLTIEALTGIAETTIRNLDHWQAGQNSPHEIKEH